MANFAQLPLVAPPIISANQAAVEEIMERYAELMQRLLEVLSSGRPRSSKLMEEDERLMDGLKKRILARKRDDANDWGSTQDAG